MASIRKAALAAAGLLIAVGLLHLAQVSRHDELPPAPARGDIGRAPDSPGGAYPGDAATIDPASIVAAPEVSIASPPPASLQSQPAPSSYERLMAGMFEQEPIDVAWARQMESEIYGILATQGISAVATAAHCRTTMCRIELIAGTDNEDFGAFMRAFDSLRIGEKRLIGFFDTHRGRPTDSNPRFWQAYLTGPGISQALRDEVYRVSAANARVKR